MGVKYLYELIFEVEWQSMEYGFLGLFALCFLSSTLYPLASEAFVLGFAFADYNLIYVWIVASAGNTLGSLSSYYLAYFCAPWLKSRLSAKTNIALERFIPKVQKYGFLYAFFVFLPIVGDIFALALGFVRYHQILCVFGIALGKIARYGVLLIPFMLK